MEIAYQTEPNLSVVEYIDIMRRSTLALRRPVDKPDVVQTMLTGADLVITARVDGKLVGLSRAITDFGYCTYLADLAVDVEHQRQGIGRTLIERTHKTAGRHTLLILLAAPQAEAYYPHIGMIRHKSCWTIPPEAETTGESPKPSDQ